jgi:hypothetical protein
MAVSQARVFRRAEELGALFAKFLQEREHSHLSAYLRLDNIAEPAIDNDSADEQGGIFR